jgi:hypothetical protein
MRRRDFLKAALAAAVSVLVKDAPAVAAPAPVADPWAAFDEAMRQGLASVPVVMPVHDLVRQRHDHWIKRQERQTWWLITGIGATA